MDMTEGGIRHWRNGTRDIKLDEFLRLCKAAQADPLVILRRALEEPDGRRSTEKLAAVKGQRRPGASL